MWVPSCVVTATKSGAGPATEIQSPGQVDSREHRLELACNSLWGSPPYSRVAPPEILPSSPSSQMPCPAWYYSVRLWLNTCSGGWRMSQGISGLFFKIFLLSVSCINSQGPSSCVWNIAAASYLSLCFQSPPLPVLTPQNSPTGLFKG